ncbi:MAG: glutamate ligase domain-containing protein, partial [Steroidobacteraceae bacterium]
AGAWALRAALSVLLEQRAASGASQVSLRPEPCALRSVLVFGCMKDKAYEEMAQILFPLFDRVIVTPVASPRSATADDLLHAAEKTGVPASRARDGHEALEAAWSEAGPNGLVVVAGSVYLVGEVRPLLHQHRAVTVP